ncbi:hypothetical protein [Lysobacter gummosus]
MRTGGGADRMKRSAPRRPNRAARSQRLPQQMRAVTLWLKTPP